MKCCRELKGIGIKCAYVCVYDTAPMSVLSFLAQFSFPQKVLWQREVVIELAQHTKSVLRWFLELVVVAETLLVLHGIPSQVMVGSSVGMYMYLLYACMVVHHVPTSVARRRCSIRCEGGDAK